MADIHINIGSNQAREMNIKKAIKAVQQAFSAVLISSVYESRAYGFCGDDFYNVGVNAKTDLSIIKVCKILRDIEKKQGRKRILAKFSARIIDLDLVLYDGVIDKNHNLPRDDILKYDFVLQPLAELNPDLIHPLAMKTYQQLWGEFKTDEPLKSYNINQIYQSSELL